MSDTNSPTAEEIIQQGNNGGDGGPEGDDSEGAPNYRIPPERTLQEIVAADSNDESLRKYKETLLGGAAAGEEILIDSNNPNRVIVTSLAMVVEGRPDILLDLTTGLDELKKAVFTVKEGIQYRIRIDFYVQREIVTGLKYVQKIYRHGVQVEKMNQMMGSYAPKKDVQSYLSPQEEMPSGMLARGTYTVKSLFTDIDKNEHLKWEWTFELKKDWQ